MIGIFSHSRYQINKKKLAGQAQSLLDQYTDDKNSTVNLIFVGTRKMRQIAQEYKKENVVLPILSFAYTDKNEDDLIGEIFICYPQAVLLAAEREKKVDKIIIELVEHGMRNICST